MKRYREIGILALVAVFVFFPQSNEGQGRPDRLGIEGEVLDAVDTMMKEGHIPSATIALVSGSSVLMTKAFGLTNVWAGTKAATDSVYLIGSTFKTMSMYSLLQFLDKGLFKLDDPVHKYLKDLSISGEDPDNPVTFRHLLSHASGLPGDFGPHPVFGPTVPPSLVDYLKSKLELTDPPLTKVVYSNLAYTLIAHLIEEFSGGPFIRHIKDNIFKPLEMTDTDFVPRPDMEERMAMPYVYNEQTGKQVPTIKFKANVWPAGIVWGTIQDQANWLIANLNGGVFKGRRLVSEQAFSEMMTRQYDQFAAPISAGWLNETTGFGLTWWISDRNGEKIFAHSGSVSGYTAFLAGNLDNKTGVAFLTNGNRAHAHLFKCALTCLDLMSGRLGKSGQ